MPTAAEILDGLRAIANEWRWLAIAWHLFLGAFVIAIATRRPSQRTMAYLLAAPLASVSLMAWTSGNPFNTATFAAGAIVLAAVASRVAVRPIRFAAPRLLVSGVLLVVFGWVYPHFLRTSSWTEYLYASPFGLIPCPTLAAILGLTLMLDTFGSSRWGLIVGVFSAFYGAIGALKLGVALDVVLLAGAVVFGGAAAAGGVRRGPRRVPARRDEERRQATG